MPFLINCGGTFILKKDLVAYKDFDGELSCMGNRCCYPFKEKIMICNEATMTGAGVFVRYYFDKR